MLACFVTPDSSAKLITRCTRLLRRRVRCCNVLGAGETDTRRLLCLDCVQCCVCQIWYLQERPPQNSYDETERLLSCYRASASICAISPSLAAEDEANVKHVMVSRAKTRLIYLRDVFFVSKKSGGLAALFDRDSELTGHVEE